MNQGGNHLLFLGALQARRSKGRRDMTKILLSKPLFSFSLVKIFARCQRRTSRRRRKNNIRVAMRICSTLLSYSHPCRCRTLVLRTEEKRKTGADDGMRNVSIDQRTIDWKNNSFLSVDPLSNLNFILEVDKHRSAEISNETIVSPTELVLSVRNTKSSVERIRDSPIATSIPNGDLHRHVIDSN